MSKFYITTAIAYVNATPHIGFAFEVVAADVMARFRRLCGDDVFFLTGSDEHSANVERRAREAGLSPQEYCDMMVEKYKEAWQRLNISYNDFIRTTSQRHIKGVQEIMKRLYEGGYLYKSKYEGWYCVSCEAFYKDSELVEGRCPIHDREPEWLSEENYFFSLSKFQEPLLEYFHKHPHFLQPQSRRNEILNIINGGLQDVSASRASTKWGVELPFDSQQVTYIWFDALINYLTGIGFPEDMDKFNTFWPADVHVIGKDITRFHSIIWPAVLMAVGLPLPERVFAHGFVNIQGQKISKTAGNIVDPVELADEFGTDAVRFYLMRDIPLDEDGNFSVEGLVRRVNTDLANDLGNLASRVLAMVERYLDGWVPRPLSPEGEDNALLEAAEHAFDIEELMGQFKYAEALMRVWELVNAANRYVESQAPWALARVESKRSRLESVLYNLLEALTKIAFLLYPFIPQACQKLWEQLGKPLGELEDARFDKMKEWGKLPAGIKVNKGEPLFPRLDTTKYF